MRRLTLALALIALLMSAWVPTARGQTFGGIYYLDPGGVGGICSDARLPTEAASPATPWCSFARAAGAAPPDSVVLVRQANLPRLDLDGERRAALVTFAPVSGEQVVLDDLDFSDSSFVRVEGFRVTGRVDVDSGSHHIYIVGSSLQGVNLTAGVDDVLIERNLISSPSGTAVNLSSDLSRPPITDIGIRGNRFDDIAVDAIQAKNFRNLLVEGNEFTGVRRKGAGAHPDVFQSVFGGSNLVIRGNWLHDYEAQGIFLAGDQVTGVLLENNLIEESDGPYVEVTLGKTTNVALVNNTVIGLTRGGAAARNVVLKNNVLRRLDLGSQAAMYEDYNLVWEGDARGRNDIRAAPRFVNAGAGNYELSADSPAVDAAISDGAPGFDLIGRLRVDDPVAPNRGLGPVDYFDMGALERGGTYPAGPFAVPFDVSGLSVRVRVPRQSLASVLDQGLLAVTSCDKGCRISAGLFIDRRVARRLALAHGAARARLVRIGRGTLSLRSAAKATVVVELTRTARKWLRRARRVPVLLRVTVTDAAGRRVRVRRRLTLLAKASSG
jgi:hypothetical protein